MSDKYDRKDNKHNVSREDLQRAKGGVTPASHNTQSNPSNKELLSKEALKGSQGGVAKSQNFVPGSKEALSRESLKGAQGGAARSQNFAPGASKEALKPEALKGAQGGRVTSDGKPNKIVVDQDILRNVKGGSAAVDERQADNSLGGFGKNKKKPGEFTK